MTTLPKMLAAIMTPPREVSRTVYGPSSEAIKRTPPAALAALPRRPKRPQTPEAAAALATPDPTPTPSPPQHEGCTTTSSPSRTPLPVRSREKPSGIYAHRRYKAETDTEELAARPRPGCGIDPVSGRERKRIMTDDFPTSRMGKFEERRRRAARLQIQREKQRAETAAAGLQYSASSEEDSEDSEREIRRTRPGFVFDRVINKERKRNMMDDFKEAKHEERRRQRKRRRQE